MNIVILFEKDFIKSKKTLSKWESTTIQRSLLANIFSHNNDKLSVNLVVPNTKIYIAKGVWECENIIEIELAVPIYNWKSKEIIYKCTFDCEVDNVTFIDIKQSVENVYHLHFLNVLHAYNLLASKFYKYFDSYLLKDNNEINDKSFGFNIKDKFLIENNNEMYDKSKLANFYLLSMIDSCNVKLALNNNTIDTYYTDYIKYNLSIILSNKKPEDTISTVTNVSEYVDKSKRLHNVFVMNIISKYIIINNILYKNYEHSDFYSTQEFYNMLMYNYHTFNLVMYINFLLLKVDKNVIKNKEANSGFLSALTKDYVYTLLIINVEAKFSKWNNFIYYMLKEFIQNNKDMYTEKCESNHIDAIIVYIGKTKFVGLLDSQKNTRHSSILEIISGILNNKKHLE